MSVSGPWIIHPSMSGKGPKVTSGSRRTIAMGPGPGRVVTVNSRVLPSRSTRTVTLASGSTSRRMRTTWREGSSSLSSVPFTATITSPARMPASAAGPPGLTAASSAAVWKVIRWRCNTFAPRSFTVTSASAPLIGELFRVTHLRQRADEARALLLQRDQSRKRCLVETHLAQQVIELRDAILESGHRGMRTDSHHRRLAGQALEPAFRGGARGRRVHGEELGGRPSWRHGLRRRGPSRPAAQTNPDGEDAERHHAGRRRRHAPARESVPRPGALVAAALKLPPVVRGGRRVRQPAQAAAESVLRL